MLSNYFPLELKKSYRKCRAMGELGLFWEIVNGIERLFTTFPNRARFIS